MIKLTRFDGEEIHVAPSQIETAQATPHTRLTLVSGRQIHVRDTIDEVAAAMLAWYRAVHAPGPKP
jgi:uncharacterized protein YlzI (FlbEa/FlbD family)